MSRVLTTPYHARQLLRALQQNIELYERNYGEIRSDFQTPVTEDDGHDDELGRHSFRITPPPSTTSPS